MRCIDVHRALQSEKTKFSELITRYNKLKADTDLQTFKHNQEGAKLINQLSVTSEEVTYYRKHCKSIMFFFEIKKKFFFVFSHFLCYLSFFVDFFFNLSFQAKILILKIQVVSLRKICTWLCLP